MTRKRRVYQLRYPTSCHERMQGFADVLSNNNIDISRMTAPHVNGTDTGTDGTTVASRWKWDDEMTKALILWRGSNQGLFTGHRNAATRGFETWVKEMELEGKVTVDYLKKKWENLKKKYKDCKNPPTGRSTEGGEATAANWKWYGAMDDMLGEKHSVTPLALGSSSAPDGAVLSHPSEERATTVTSPSTSHSESPSPSTSTASASASASTSAPAPKKAKNVAQWLLAIKEMERREEAREAREQEWERAMWEREEKREREMREREEREEKREREREEREANREREIREREERREKETREREERLGREAAAREERFLQLMEFLVKK